MSSENTGHSELAGSKVNWLPLVLSAVVVLGLIIFIFKGCNGSDQSQEALIGSDSTRFDSTAVSAELPTHESMKVKLPDGVELNAYKGGIEDRLVSFLNDPSSLPGKDVWFDFDNLNFKTGSADITEESLVQIQNLSSILKSYPKLKIKIGGYTDKTGDSLNNMKLSQSRADAVVAALKADSANAAQLTGAEGYGSEYAKAAADAPDSERKTDRRIAVSVRAK